MGHSQLVFAKRTCLNIRLFKVLGNYYFYRMVVKFGRMLGLARFDGKKSICNR
jgi:hypothetical protein